MSAALLPPGTGLAQTAPPTAVEGVTVTAPNAALTTSIDRRSYSVGADIAATTGSAADVLRNVPSVSIDAQGGLSLRGDRNVAVLIDGKRSAEFSGDNLANALAAFPGAQIDRIEVITNPSAAFNADGAAVINLVLKRSRGGGWSGNARASFGDRGQLTAGVTGGYNARSLAVTADATARRWYEVFDTPDERTDLAAGGVSRDFRHLSAVIDLVSARLGADYEIDSANRLTGGLRYSESFGEGYVSERFEADGPPVFISERAGTGGNNNLSLEASGGYRRKLAGDRHELSLDLRTDVFDRTAGEETLYRVGAPTAGVFEKVRADRVSRSTDLKAEYLRPLPGEGRLVLGAQSDTDTHDFDDETRRGLDKAGAVSDPVLRGLFHYRQALTAVYGTVQRPVGEVTVLAGLRLENVEIDTRSRIGGQTGGQDYAEAYPSLHLSRPLGEGLKGTASYSRRVRRPGPFDLNPAPALSGARLYRVGNPDLEPEFTDAFEASVEHRRGQTSYLATVYHRAGEGSFTTVYRPQADGTVLITSENLGESLNTGLELVANGRLAPKLTYSLNANVYRLEISAPNLGFNQERAATTVSGRGSLDWQLTGKDLLQVGVVAYGKRLLPQGYRTASQYMTFAYRHRFDDRLAMTFTVKDAFETTDDVVVIATPAYRSTTLNQPKLRNINIGLTYAFGGGRRQESGFDFGGG